MQALYRWFNADHELLYVGISQTLFNRVKDHAKGSDWVHQASYMTVSWYETRHEVETAELGAIRNEGPLYNITGNNNPGVKKYSANVIASEIRTMANEIYSLKRSLAFTKMLLERTQLENDHHQVRNDWLYRMERIIKS